MNEIKKINVGGVAYDIVSKELTKITYAELKALRDNGQLSEGHLYRITDYVTMTTETNTKSAGNVFDVIVLATSANELSHIARAIQHEGDTYFDGNDLGAWELWYDLDNDTEKYEWADATNGKGVIYRMIDEKRNDCPYDFKNILFYNSKLTASTTSDKYYYIFSYVVSGKLYDGTVEKQVLGCYSNRIGLRYLGRKLSLNSNVFRNTSFSSPCNSNTFGTGCHANTFGNSCYGNTFGNSCDSNTFGNNCNYNTFGNYCGGNIFGDSCNYNTFGNSCSYNTFKHSCNYNTFGNSCSYNTFKHSCNYNTFSGSCFNSTFGADCESNTFGQKCNYNTFGNSCSYNTFGNNCQDRSIDDSKTSIIINEEYYDDGSGQLVPIKHPDLSTQPSILPYKFMGQYVYEQLIPKDVIANYGERFINIDVLSPIGLYVLEAVAIGNTNTAHIDCDIHPDDGVAVPAFNHDKHDYLRIIYTSTPEEGGYYYNMDNTGIRFYVEAAANYRAFMPDVNGEELPVLKDNNSTYIFASAATIQRLCDSHARIELDSKCYSVTVRQGSGEAYIGTDGRTIEYSGDDWRNSTVKISVG